MNNLDPEIRKFLLHQVSETFSEIRKFVTFQEYDRHKVFSGLQELCALFDLEIIEKPEEEIKIYPSCQSCGKKKLSNKRLHYPYCDPCERQIRQKRGKRKILKIEENYEKESL